MFSFIEKALKKIYTACTSKFQAIFARPSVDNEALGELERVLIEADTGARTTKKIIDSLKSQVSAGAIKDGASLRVALNKYLVALLSTPAHFKEGDVILLVGVNGSGKTTLAAKLSYRAQRAGVRTLLVAADTFRAAAQEQLGLWATKLNVPVTLGKPGGDPASVVFLGCHEYKKGLYEKLIIDTAGRLQTKTNLMKELEKIKRVVTQQLPGKSVSTILTVDAMLGQNSFEQARVFHESTHLDALALTKMDGTGKGGIVFSIVEQLSVPVAYITCGENADQLEPFDAQGYVDGLLG